MRVAATPETVKKYMALGADVVVQAGAGANAGLPDGEYELSARSSRPMRPRPFAMPI